MDLRNQHFLKWQNIDLHSFEYFPHLRLTKGSAEPSRVAPIKPTGFLFKTEEVRGLDAQSNAFFNTLVDSGIVLWTYNDDAVNVLYISSKGCYGVWCSGNF